MASTTMPLEQAKAGRGPILWATTTLLIAGIHLRAQADINFLTTCEAQENKICLCPGEMFFDTKQHTQSGQLSICQLLSLSI